MPEGPSIVILKEAVERLGLKGKVIRHVEGNSKIDKDRLIGERVTDFRSWGKHFLKICPRCDIPFHMEYLGRTKRRRYFCENCQRLYD